MLPKANELLTTGASLDAINAYYAGVLQVVRTDRDAFQALCANECIATNYRREITHPTR